MKNTLLYIVIGAVTGVVLAEIFPNLGKGSFEGGMNNLAYSLGKTKPYLNFGLVGAVAGAVVGALSGRNGQS